MTALDVAKYIVAFADCKGDLITNKKLQKLLYYVQAWSLTIFDNRLFDEQPIAWRHGPVYNSVYQTFKQFGYQPVSIKEEYGEGSNCDQWLEHKRAELFSKEQSTLIEEVLLKYGRLSAFDLEILTHRERPWLEQREGLDDFASCENPISFDTMKAYYSGLMKVAA